LLSLLDTADHWVADWWLVFRDLPAEATTSPLWRLLKPGFQHVECWRCDRGIWLRIEPCYEMTTVEAHESPPWELVLPELSPTVLHVQRAVAKGRLREPFFVGPWTCVEIAKSIIGLRAPFVRTPWQLYKVLK
jgi:hypothetical protein